MIAAIIDAHPKNIAELAEKTNYTRPIQSLRPNASSCEGAQDASLLLCDCKTPTNRSLNHESGSIRAVRGS